MSKLNIILDLDNTIISSKPKEEIEWDSEFEKKASKFTYHDMEDYYLVFERPYLQEFLDYLFENFNVSIWSAATKDYVLFIVKNVIQTPGKNRPLDLVLFSYHCSLSNKTKKGPKALELLEKKFNLPQFSLDKTYILDDLSDVYNSQPDNCILVDEFEFDEEDSEKDDYLTTLKEKLEDLKE